MSLSHPVDLPSEAPGRMGTSGRALPLAVLLFSLCSCCFYSVPTGPNSTGAGDLWTAPQDEAAHHRPTPDAGGDSLAGGNELGGGECFAPMLHPDSGRLFLALSLTLHSLAGPAAAGRAAEGSGCAVLLRSQGSAREEDQEQEVRLCHCWAWCGGRGLGPGLGAGADPDQCVGLAKTGRKAG